MLRVEDPRGLRLSVPASRRLAAHLTARAGETTGGLLTTIATLFRDHNVVYGNAAYSVVIEIYPKQGLVRPRMVFCHAKFENIRVPIPICNQCTVKIVRCVYRSCVHIGQYVAKAWAHLCVITLESEAEDVDPPDLQCTADFLGQTVPVTVSTMLPYSKRIGS